MPLLTLAETSLDPYVDSENNSRFSPGSNKVLHILRRLLKFSAFFLKADAGARLYCREIEDFSWLHIQQLM